MEPPCDGTKPLRRSKSVVFPAPLGPIIPMISFDLTSKVTELTAKIPPKLRVISSISRIVLVSLDDGLELVSTAEISVLLRKTERRRSGRFKSSLVEPANRICPFSMK